MGFHTITIADAGLSYRCSEDQTVLEGMERLGKRGIPIGCRGGGCGVCKVEVLAGTYRAEVMSADHVSPEDRAAQRVLACRIWPSSDLTVRVIGAVKKRLLKETGPQGANLEISY